MKQTEHCQLNQWDKEDRIMMDDFNADNARIDAALQAEAAARAAGDAALSGRCRIVSGAYTGTGGSSVSIVCGFRPKLLLVAFVYSNGYAIAGPYSGEFGTGFQMYLDGANYINTYVGGSTSGKTIYAPSSNGLSWSSTCPDSSYVAQMAMNGNGKSYVWVALG